LASDFTARTYDNVGRLHINRSHISKACVNPYYGREIPGGDALGLEPDKIYYLLRSPEELTKAASSFARLPILSKHVPVTAEDLPTEFIVGAVGSDVEFLHPYLDADTSYWDATAIAGIETDQIREHSCAYHYKPVMSPGTYEGVHYDGVMTEIRGNHLALVEAGRAGPDVLAADSKLGDPPMKMTKLGKALTVALTTAFPKLQAKLAMDSSLSTLKLIGGARHATFDKDEATKQILALDAECPKEQVKAVMDALVDVDDPEPSKKDNGGKEEGAKDEEEEESEEDKKKKAAKDKKTAKDEEEEKDKKDKAAMDAAIDTKVAVIRAELREADEARRDVRSVVGDVVAQDSASSIYEFALDEMKVEHKGVEGVAALKALFTLAKSHKAAPVEVIAADAAVLTKKFPGFDRVRVM
jgi:hypothetical protein